MNTRLTPDLRFLQKGMPREPWGQLPKGSLAATWLAMHESLRHGQQWLERVALQWQLKQLDYATFRERFLAGSEGHFSHLHAHHRLEDQHYFPQFRRLEPRLQAGFDLLHEDHAEVDAALSTLQAQVRELRAADVETDASRALADAIAVGIYRCGQLLTRHLDDEEDLVIPLLGTLDTPGNAA